MANTVKLRNGLETNRAGQTPVLGAPLWVTDTQYLYVGDGSTAGGLPVKIAWSNVDGTPTTLSGYGITDGLLNTTDTLTGTLTVTTSVLVDTIDERTGAAGVTVEGVLLKDSDAFIEQITIGNDEMTVDNEFYITAIFEAPYFNFDNGDYWAYSRALNEWDWRVATASIAKLNATAFEVDAINELTTDAGVTVDSVELKDGQITTTGTGASFIGHEDYGWNFGNFFSSILAAWDSQLSDYTLGHLQGSSLIINSLDGDLALAFEKGSTTPHTRFSVQGTTGNHGPDLKLQRARGDSGSATTVVAGDVLGRVSAHGYDGTAYDEAASIEATANVAGSVVTADLTYTADLHDFAGTVETDGRIGIGTPAHANRAIEALAVGGDLAWFGNTATGLQLSEVFGILGLNAETTGGTAKPMGLDATNYFISLSGTVTATIATDGVTTGLRRGWIRLYKTSSQNIGGANGTATAITWQTQDEIDTAHFTHSTGTNPSRITVDQDGWYDVSAAIGYDNTGTNRANIALVLKKEGTTFFDTTRRYSYSRGTGYGDSGVAINTTIYLSDTDYLEVIAEVEDADQTTAINTVVAGCELIMKLVS